MERKWSDLPDARDQQIADQEAEIERLWEAAAFVIDCYADGDSLELKDAVTRLRDVLAGKEGK